MRPGQEDIRHPKLKLLMDPYLKRYKNYVNIPEILTTSGKGMSDLPTLPKYCHPCGQSFLCWNCVLGRCFRGPWCRFARGHLKKGKSTDLFCRQCHRRHQQRGATLHKPPNRGGRDRLPQEQAKWQGSQRPYEDLTTVGTGCSWMQNGGRVQRNRIAGKLLEP